MSKSRLEAFSDGVIAVIITIMVLELKIPHGANLESIKPLLPTLTCYILSFVFVAIYWNNHHHMLHATKEVSGKILWANFHLLFWLSLLPFVTGWMGENHFSSIPVAAYGVVSFMSGLAYYILAHSLVAHHGKDSVLAKAIGRDYKGKISVIIYAIAILLAFVAPVISVSMYVIVAGMWLIPDRRIEKNLRH